MPKAQRGTLTSSEAASFVIAVECGILRHLERAADEGFRAHIAEQDIRICHGRLGAAALIGGRPRHRARRARPDIEQAERVLRRDRAAAGADLDHADRLDFERKARALAEAMIVRDLEIGADGRLAVRDQAQFCGGAAHVEGQHAALAGDVGRIRPRRPRLRPDPIQSGEPATRRRGCSARGRPTTSSTAPAG